MSETRVAPWQAASASLRQMVGWRSRWIGSSGVVARLSRRIRPSSAAMPTPISARKLGSALALMRCACCSASSTGRDEGDEQHEPHAVERPRLLAAGALLEAQRQQHGDQPQRQIDEEDRAPAEVLGEQAADHRPEGGGGDGDAGEIALVAGALARRDGLADQRLRQRHQAAAAQPLQDAADGQHLDAGRCGAEDGGRQEDGERHEHHAPAAVDVAQLAVDGGGDGAGEQVGDDHPRHALDVAERGGNRRQRRGDDGLVHHRQEHRQHDGGKDGEEQPAGGGRWLGGVFHAAILWPVGPNKRSALR